MQIGSWSGGGKKYLALVMYIHIQYIGASTFSWGRQLGGSMMIMNKRLINTAQNSETSECPCPTGGIRLKISTERDIRVQSTERRQDVLHIFSNKWLIT